MSSRETFHGLSSEFVRDFMAMGSQGEYKKGTVLFKEGDDAEYLYILVKGNVSISIGESGPMVYTVSHPGEVFGWSCLLGRSQYSATAECKEDSTLIKIRGDQVEAFLEKDASKAAHLFKDLAKILVNRLLQAYRIITDISSTASISYGSGQVVQLDKAE